MKAIRTVSDPSGGGSLLHPEEQVQRQRTIAQFQSMKRFLIEINEPTSQLCFPVAGSATGGVSERTAQMQKRLKKRFLVLPSMLGPLEVCLAETR